MRDYAGPFILIGIGIYLLLFQMDFIAFNWVDLITYGFILIGFLMFINAFSRTDRRGILGGVFFMSYGTTLSLMRHRVVFPDDNFGWGTLFLALALGNLVYYLVKPDRTGNLVWSLIFGLVGSGLISVYLGYFTRWEITSNLEMYWPFALIILGVALIIKTKKGMKGKEEDTAVDAY